MKITLYAEQRVTTKATVIFKRWTFIIHSKKSFFFLQVFYPCFELCIMLCFKLVGFDMMLFVIIDAMGEEQMLIHLKNCCQIQIYPKCLRRKFSWPFKAFSASWVILLQIVFKERNLKSNKAWNRCSTKYQYFSLLLYISVFWSGTSVKISSYKISRVFSTLWWFSLSFLFLYSTTHQKLSIQHDLRPFQQYL